MTDDSDLRARVNRVLAEEFELDPDDLREDANLYEDLGLDSLDAVDMVVALEKECGLKFTDEEALRSVRTMRDLYELVSRLYMDIKTA
jgi:acyl carrier protein